MSDERTDQQNDTQAEQPDQPRVPDLASKTPTVDEAEIVKGGIARGEHIKDVIITT